MKVLFDYQCFQQRFGGVSVCFAELWKRLPKDISPIMPKIISDNINLDEIGIKHYKASLTKGKYLKNLYKYIDQLICKRSLLCDDYDIFHPTFLHPYYINCVKKNVPVVCTQHDLIHEKTSRFDSKVVRERRKKQLEYADIVVCVSNQTKEELLEYYDFLDPNKVKTIYNGIVSPKVSCSSKPLYDFPYILYVGGRNGYKNFDNFIKAFSKIDKSISLVCTGNSFNTSEIELLNKFGVQDRTYQKFVTNEDLVNLYCNALAFVYPSLMEGFGIPTLDALSAGCPAIISDIPCFHEVGGTAVAYFEPTDPDSIFNSDRKSVV